MSEDAARIRRQVEYYFSDANFRRDQFLQAKAGEDAQGFVPIDVLLTFNRLKKIAEDAKAVSHAVLDSKLVTLSADGTKIRRNTPLPATDDSRACMVYMKGFPETVTLEQLEKWGPNGDVARYVLRRVPGQKDKQKPSIFVEMRTPEAAAAIVKQHAETPLEYDGKALLDVRLRDEYLRAKREERAAAGGGRKGGRGAKIREEDLMAGFKRDPVPGAIVKLTGLPENTDGDALDTALRTLAEVRFVELTEEQKDAAIVRTASAAASAKLVTACKELAALKEAGKPLDAEAEEGKTTEEAGRAARKAIADACQGTVPGAAVLEGDECSAYWDRVFALQARKYRARVLQRMRKTERDVIPAGTPAPAEAAASASASSSASSSGDAEPARAAKRPAEESADAADEAKRAKTDEAAKE